MDAIKAKIEAMAAHPEGTVPAFAVNFTPTLRADGQLWLIEEMDGATVAVQPKGWRGMSWKDNKTEVSPAGGSIAPLNAGGVIVPEMQQHVGQIQSNDETFGATGLAGTECRVNQPSSPSFGSIASNPCVISTVIIGLALVLVALILRYRP